MDVLNESKILLAPLQSWNITISKSHTLLFTNIKGIDALNDFPGEHSILAREAEKAMSFQKVELRKGRSPVVNQAEFIQAVVHAFHYHIKQSTT